MGMCRELTLVWSHPFGPLGTYWGFRPLVAEEGNQKKNMSDPLVPPDHTSLPSLIKKDGENTSRDPFLITKCRLSNNGRGDGDRRNNNNKNLISP